MAPLSLDPGSCQASAGIFAGNYNFLDTWFLRGVLVALMSVFKKNTQPPKGQPSSQRRRLAAAADARFPTVALIAARSWTSVGESEEGGGGGY